MQTVAAAKNHHWQAVAPIQKFDELAIDDVHRTAGRIPSDKRDAVCVGIELEVDVSHRVP
jgi:hypothetical protein